MLTKEQRSSFFSRLSSAEQADNPSLIARLMAVALGAKDDACLLSCDLSTVTGGEEILDEWGDELLRELDIHLDDDLGLTDLCHDSFLTVRDMMTESEQRDYLYNDPEQVLFLYRELEDRGAEDFLLEVLDDAVHDIEGFCDSITYSGPEYGISEWVEDFLGDCVKELHNLPDFIKNHIDWQNVWERDLRHDYSIYGGENSSEVLILRN